VMEEKGTLVLLKQVITQSFGIVFDGFDYAKYPVGMPRPLQEIYEMDAQIARSNCSYERVQFKMSHRKFHHIAFGKFLLGAIS
jgi:hypothetical protein